MKDNRPPLSVRQLATRLGVPVPMARRMAKCGEIASVKTPSGIRVSPRDVDRYIDDCQRAARVARPPTLRQLWGEAALEAALWGEPLTRPRQRERAGTARRRAARSSARSGDSGDDDPAPAGFARLLIGGAR